jgi:hypothetical protein
MENKIIISDEHSPSVEVTDKVEDFLDAFQPHETKLGVPLVLYCDEKSGAYYLVCHIDAGTLVSNADLEASLDGSEGDAIYKLNREISEAHIAYRQMEGDARKGRSFEDLVIEYDTSYRREIPLKVYGGQHRVRAITNALKSKKNILHGVRVYFDLNRDQKVEIAMVNNTSIAVSKDLLDRMREQLLGNELRFWGQRAGLINYGRDYSDRRNPDVPTIRIARTLLVNFFRGQNEQPNAFHNPVVCKSGGLDENYLALRKEIDWGSKALLEMGRAFAALHQAQREVVLNREKDSSVEYARKALSLSVVASWSYAAGLFQRDRKLLKILYNLPKSVKPPDDPLNAKALSGARLKGVDHDRYRGLGVRFSQKELGRMLEVFILLATMAKQKRVTRSLANVALQTYEAKAAKYEADKAIGKI